MPRYLNRQLRFAESSYDSTWDCLNPYIDSKDDLQMSKKELEDHCMTEWHRVRICTNEAQEPELWFEKKISLLRDGWYRDSPTMLESVTDFVKIVILIMESGESGSNITTRALARRVLNKYIANNLGTYPPPNTRDELFETVATILRKCWTTVDESDEFNAQPILQAWKALAWEV